MPADWPRKSQLSLVLDQKMEHSFAANFQTIRVRIKRFINCISTGPIGTQWHLWQQGAVGNAVIAAPGQPASLPPPLACQGAECIVALPQEGRFSVRICRHPYNFRRHIVPAYSSPSARSGEFLDAGSSSDL